MDLNKLASKALRLVPLATFLAIALSAIKVVLYYGMMGISIVEFMEPDEFLVLFVDDLVFYFFATVFSLSVDYYEHLRKIGIRLGIFRGKIQPTVLDLKELQLEDRMEILFKTKIASTGFVLFVFFAVVWFLFNELSISSLWFIYLYGLLSFLAIQSDLKGTPFGMDRNIASFLFIFSLVCVAAITQGLYAKDGDRVSVISMDTSEGDKITSSCKDRFIGQTRGFVVLFNVDTKIGSFISKKEMAKITILRSQPCEDDFDSK